MKKLIALSVCWLITVVFPGSALGCREEQVIERIAVFGNQHVKTATVKRIIRIREGDLFSRDSLSEARERLERLEIFKIVAVEEKQGEKGIIIIISVKEKSLLFFYPVFNIGGASGFNFNEEEEKSYYGLSLGFNDFSGRGHHFSLESGYGNLKKIAAQYRNEYFPGFTWGGEIQNMWYRSDIYDTDVTKTVGSIFVGKAFGRLETRAWGRLDRFSFDVSPQNDVLSRLYKVGLDFSFDARNIPGFPSQGFFSSCGVYKAMGSGRKTVYDRAMLQFSSFFGVWKKHVLALDFNGVFTRGDVPVTDRLYFGGIRSLRGIPIGAYSGRQSLVFSAEYRIPLSKFSKKPSSLGPLGAACYLFLDVGSIEERLRDIRGRSFRANSGVGFFWILSTDGGLKLDLSIQPDFRLTVSSIWKF